MECMCDAVRLSSARCFTGVCNTYFSMPSHAAFIVIWLRVSLFGSTIVTPVWRMAHRVFVTWLCVLKRTTKYSNKPTSESEERGMRFDMNLLYISGCNWLPRVQFAPGPAHWMTGSLDVIGWCSVVEFDWSTCIYLFEWMTTEPL